jgi:outer membrane immunogenic protein
MRKLLISTSAAAAALLAVCDPGLAAEPVALEYDWSGFYLGLNAGYFFSETDADVFIPAGANINANARGIANGALTGNVDSDGFIGGATVGVNHQNNNFVFGIEGDIDFLDLDETRNSGVILGVGQNGVGIDRLDGDILATLRLRAGIAAGETLFYITGGGAFTDADITRTLDWTFADGCPLVGGGRQRCHAGDGDFDFGYTVGGGIERAFGDWSVKAEYLFADFGNENFTTDNASPAIAGQFMQHRFDLEMHIIRLGLNVHF